ncbi:hypothetical protein [Neorhizobium alkalisoli]|uniref:Uncharacterized protein n=1 Tax=Neorhizobium alkalisoli TaxID=528178 RepID=A0A561QGJ8_9HYPH|nr:hypothetical protein [Neorhizobium alkalisoli]TWF49473.1 hypothetical protein FHW37_108143 [Neorhizobium alkalisoli]
MKTIPYPHFVLPPSALVVLDRTRNFRCVQSTDCGHVLAMEENPNVLDFYSHQQVNELVMSGRLQIQLRGANETDDVVEETVDEASAEAAYDRALRAIADRYVELLYRQAARAAAANASVASSETR